MKKVLSIAWDSIRQASESTSQVALAIAAIFWASIAGGAVVAVYGFAVRDCDFGCRIAGSFLGLVCGACAFSVGGMMGLLFGAPSWSGSSEASAKAEPTSSDEHRGGQVRPNSRLDRVAEWLTTMIVGLGLVNLSAIQSKATDAGIWLTRAITDDPKELNGTPGVMLMISFAFAGFMLVYLWSLRFLPSELRSSYSELKAVVAQADKSKSQLNEVISYTKQVFADFKNKPLFTVPEYELKQSIEKMQTGGVDTATCQEIEQRYARAATGNDEPLKLFGPSSESGFALASTVKDEGAGNFSIRVSLTAPTDTDIPHVYWLLHNSFTPQVVHECPIQNGIASYTATAQESFWIGAVVPVAGSNALRLSLDLGSGTDVADAFRAGDSNPSTDPLTAV
jgi:hypothetical protein